MTAVPSQPASAHPPLRVPRTLADLVTRSLTREVVLAVGAAAAVGVLAQVSFPLPGTPVPLTLQTLGVLLAGAALGPRRAATSMGLYVIAGLAGLPWLAGGAHGLALLASATGGYLVGFVLAGAVVGALAAHGGDRTPLRAAGSMLVGTAAVYACGVAGLLLVTGADLGAALRLGVLPFLAGDALKVAAAAALLPAAWAVVARVRGAGPSAQR